MRFDLVDLRLFLNVHEAGTMTAGAAATHMTLASASERIRNLEDSLGAPLLTRGPRGTQLTAAGRTLLHHARQVILQVDRLQGDLEAWQGGLLGQVRLMCNTSAISEHLPEVIGRFLAANCAITVNLEEQPSDAIVDALRNERCDIGIVSDSVDLAGLASFVFRPDPLVLIVAEQHPLANRRSVDFLAIVDEPFVGLVEGSALPAHLAGHARRLGRRLHYRVRLRSLESVCRVVGQAIGIAIVPDSVALRSRRSAGIRRVRLEDDWAARRLVVAHRATEQLSPQAQRLLEHLRAAAVA